jgi:hypothetical protein
MYFIRNRLKISGVVNSLRYSGTNIFEAAILNGAFIGADFRGDDDGASRIRDALAPHSIHSHGVVVRSAVVGAAALARVGAGADGTGASVMLDQPCVGVSIWRDTGGELRHRSADHAILLGYQYIAGLLSVSGGRERHRARAVCKRGHSSGSRRLQRPVQQLRRSGMPLHQQRQRR